MSEPIDILEIAACRLAYIQRAINGAMAMQEGPAAQVQHEMLTALHNEAMSDVAAAQRLAQELSAIHNQIPTYAR